jgi:hypothetical protein
MCTKNRQSINDCLNSLVELGEDSAANLCNRRNSYLLTLYLESGSGRLAVRFSLAAPGSSLPGAALCDRVMSQTHGVWERGFWFGRVTNRNEC